MIGSSNRARGSNEGLLAGLYLHIPFCERKCLYCDFYSLAPSDDSQPHELLIPKFVDALCREVELLAHDERYRTAYTTVFFGGGTPSLLSAAQIGRVLNELAGRFTISPDAEITVEANPGTIDVEKLAGYRAAGVNRLSIGVQSFRDDDLRFLSRIHDAGQAEAAVRVARAAGFDNVSIDLMFALPTQSLEQWEENLRRTIALAPEHISCYSLIVEPNTPLFRLVQSGQVRQIDPELDARMYERTMALLTGAGYEQYEVSNFARPGYRSRHNSQYWDHTPYLGLGPSAHSFWDAERWWNFSNLGVYLDRLTHHQLPIAGREALTEEQMIAESVFLGLRSDGVDLGHLRSRFGVDLVQEAGTALPDLFRDRLLLNDGERLRLTAKGYLVCDQISEVLLGWRHNS